MSHYIQNNTISTTVLTPRNRDIGDKKNCLSVLQKLFIYKETTAIPCPCNKWHLGYWDTLKHICSLPQVLGALLPFSKSPKAKKHLENGSLNGLSKCHASQEYYVSYLLFNETSVKILSYHHAFTPPLDTLNSRVYIAERWYKHWNRTLLLGVTSLSKCGELCLSS